MNSRGIGTIVVGILGMITALIVIVQVTSGAGNALATMAKFLAIGSFFFGILKPRAALIWIVFLCGYSDLLKRMMVFDSSFNYLDISFVLAMAPACLGGVTLGCLGQAGIRTNMRKSDVMVFIFCTLYFLWAVFRAVKGGSGILGAGKIAFLSACFVYAVFVAKVLLRDREEMTQFIRICLWIFAPVAVYGIYQGAVGLSAWEEAYLRAGFSTEIRMLYDVKARAFSTLNAASTLTVICAMFAMFVIIQSYGITGSAGRILHPINMLLLFIYIAAGILTYTRSGWLAFLVGVAALLLFRHKFLTVAFYISAVLAFVVLFFSAEYALQNLDTWQKALTGGRGDSLAFRITTWSDRLLGWRNLTHEPGLWTPFGFDPEIITMQNKVLYRKSPFFYHDAFTGFVLNRGYVPLIIVLACGAWFLVKAHTKMFRLPPDERRFALCLFSSIVAVSSVGITHSTILQFPVNFFYWMVVGCLVRLLWQPAEQTAEIPEKTEESVATSTELDPGGNSPAWSYYNYS